MNPQNRSMSPLELAQLLVLNEYGQKLSDIEKDSIKNAKSAAEVSLIADTLVEDFDVDSPRALNMGAYTQEGVNSDTRVSLDQVIQSENINDNNRTAHAAYLASQADKKYLKDDFKAATYYNLSKESSVGAVLDNWNKSTGSNKDRNSYAGVVNKIQAIDPGWSDSYGKYAQNMNDHMEAATQSAKQIVDNAETPKPNDRDFNSAFKAQQASLTQQVKTDETGIIAGRLNQSKEDQKNVQQAISSIEDKISDIPSSGIVSADRAEQKTATLNAEKARVEKFGTEVANMNPQERENLTNFFNMVENEPEKAKSFINDVQVKEAKVELVEQKIDKVMSGGIGSADRMEQKLAPLTQEKAKLEAAPLEHAPNSKPEYVSALNPTGDIQKQRDLDAFFKAAEKQAQKPANASPVPGEYRPASAILTPTKQTQPAPRSGGGPTTSLSGGNSPSGVVPAAPKIDVTKRPPSGGGGGVKYM